jgi:hypothetical protein
VTSTVFALEGVIVALVRLFVDVEHETTTGESRSGQKTASELLDEIFGPSTNVEQVTDTEEFAERIQTEGNSATNTIDRIHFNMYFVNRIEDRALHDPSVKHRILLVKPVQEGDTGTDTGLEIVRKSRIDTTPPSYQFEEKFETLNNRLQEDEWKNVEVRLYETTPWLRAAIIDGRKAGLLMLPSMYDGAKAAKFWTTDRDVTDTLESIFEDMWNDPRTVKFETWYKNSPYS